MKMAENGLGAETASHGPDVGAWKEETLQV